MAGTLIFGDQHSDSVIEKVNESIHSPVGIVFFFLQSKAHIIIIIGIIYIEKNQIFNLSYTHV